MQSNFLLTFLFAVKKTILYPLNDGIFFRCYTYSILVQYSSIDFTIGCSFVVYFLSQYNTKGEP